MNEATPNNAQVLTHVTQALYALQALRDLADQVQTKLEGDETNPFGSRHLMTQMIQNLKAMNFQIGRGLLEDRMGNPVTHFGDISEILERNNDLASIIDN